jgi:hypothetical protein
MYHGAMGAMQGMTPTQIYDRIADVLMDTQKAQWVCTGLPNSSRQMVYFVVCSKTHRTFPTSSRFCSAGLLDSSSALELQVRSCAAPAQCGVVD